MKHEYNREWDFFHSHVDEFAPLPTVCPKAQTLALHGVDPLFHSIHNTYCYCCYIIYLQLLYLVWADMHPA